MSTSQPKGGSRVSEVRGRPRSFREDEIVDAALRLTRQVGLDNLSMRALARELGTPPMTVYDYVRNKAGLVDLLVNHLLRDVRIPGPEEGTWDRRLRLLLRHARHVFTEHPGVSSRLGDRGAAEGRRLADGVLGILRDGGFDPPLAALAFATLYTYVTGQIAVSTGRDESAHGPPASTLEGVSRLRALPDDEIFDFGLDAVIDGLKVRLHLSPG
ncbi:MAG: TetR/AcrR family transcriptional regulator [Acidimicrobiales bacterium]